MFTALRFNWKKQIYKTFRFGTPGWITIRSFYTRFYLQYFKKRKEYQTNRNRDEQSSRPKRYYYQMIFKIISIVFILNNLYYILNYRRLDEPFRMRDKNRKLDLVHYLFKIVYLIWIILGVFKFYSVIILILASLILLRIPIHVINKNVSLVYHRLIPPFTILLLIVYLFS